MRGAGLAAAIAAAAIAGGACADFRSPSDPGRGLPDVAVAAPSFRTDVQPIFTRRCAIGGCHTFASAQGGLDLTEARSYDALVGVAARLRPSELRVRAGRPDSSWLVAMIDADSARRRGFSRMPLASAPLTENQIRTIVTWIAQGARRD